MPQHTDHQWSKAQIEALLAKESFQYQRIELPHGLATPGRDRTPTARKIFPADLRGKSVLDVGSYLGFFCFDALKRGAARAVGLELDAESVRKAKLLAAVLGLAPEFINRDVEYEPIEGRFDYVLCLNVLHHFRDPIAVMEKLARATRHKLILETVAFESRERLKTGLGKLPGRLLARYPVLYAAATGPGRDHRTPKFVIARGAIETVLGAHRNTFVRFQHSTSEFRGRYITIADKRHIKHLVVIAGVSGPARQAVIDSLRKGTGGPIAEAAGLPPASPVEVLDARDLSRIQEPNLDRLVYAYDLMVPYQHHHGRYERDDHLDILETADEVSVITVGEPAAQPRAAGASPPDHRVPTAAQYERWFAFSAPLGRGVVAVPDGPGGHQLLSPEAWMSTLGGA